MLAALTGGAVAHAAEEEPFIPATPSTGTPATTFTIIARGNLAKDVRAAQRDGSLELTLDAPKGARRSCGEPWRGDAWRLRTLSGGRIAIDLAPKRVLPDRGRWCKGSYRVWMMSTRIVDDNEETGAGGDFSVSLLRSTLRVR